MKIIQGKGKKIDNKIHFHQKSGRVRSERKKEKRKTIGIAFEMSMMIFRCEMCSMKRKRNYFTVKKKHFISRAQGEREKEGKMMNKE